MEGLVLWPCSSEEPDSPGGTSALAPSSGLGPKDSRGLISVISTSILTALGGGVTAPLYSRKLRLRERKATCPGTQQRWI